MGSKTSRLGVTLVAISVLIVSLLSSGFFPITEQFNSMIIAEEAPTSTVIWHHDCSNMTAFDGVADRSWFNFPPEFTISGSMDSIDGYIYASDFGAGSEPRGPSRYHALTSPFALSDFVDFEVEIELNSAGNSPIGDISVALHDEMSRAIMFLRVADDWVAQDDVRVQAFWQFSNSDYLETAESWPSDTPQQPYHESLKLSQNELGIFADIPRVGIFKVIDRVEINSTRIVTYVSILATSWDSYPVPEVMRVHDIELTSITPTTTLTTTLPTNTTGWNWGDLPDPIVFLITGMAGTILVLVIVIIFIRRKQ